MFQYDYIFFSNNLSVNIEYLFKNVRKTHLEATDISLPVVKLQSTRINSIANGRLIAYFMSILTRSNMAVRSSIPLAELNLTCNDMFYRQAGRTRDT